MRKIIILLFISFMLFSCGDNSQQNNEENAKVSKATSKGINVGVTKIQKQVFNKQILSNGVVGTTQKADLSFTTSQRIASIKVRNGQRVREGQTLATLNNTLLNNQLAKAQNDIDKAKQKLLEEKINYGFSEDTEIDPKLLQRLQIKSGLIDAENTYQNALLKNEESVLKAPFSGVIANLEIKTGSRINPSDVFCTLINQNKLEIVFSILENELSFVKKGQTVLLTHFNTDTKEYKATITEINPIVDKNGLIKIKASILTKTDKLFNGMHLRVIINKPIDNVLVIPKEALVLRSNRNVVFTVQNGLAKWNYVELLDENSEKYAIEGLKESDTIIISGNLNLAHDARVNVNFQTQKKK